MANGQTVNTRELRLARLRKGWTLRDVSDRCKAIGTPVDFGNLMRYERGQLKPSAKTLLALSQALETTVDALVAEDEPAGSAA